jgi:GH3 auxin-responsive promoter
MNTASSLNTAWMLKCGIEGAAFDWSSRRVARTQERLLYRLLAVNRRTWFGIRHGFDQIGTLNAYQKRVPPASYADFDALIQRIAAGEDNVLTAEPVTLLEPTSGTTGGEKLIPYTAGLRRQFQRGVAAWIADLFCRRPAVRRGRAYWSISPALGPPRMSSGGLPVSFADDAEYLGRLERFALRRLLVVPGAIARLPDMTMFRYCTLLFLLAAEDLSLISIWNPTFLLALVSSLTPSYERLCDDLSRGRINPPVALPPRMAAILHDELRPMPHRAAILEDIGRSGGSLADKVQLIWPRLALISCWTDAAAGQFLHQLRALFPTIEIQPKGLLATEALVSFPLVGKTAAALAVRSHVFEFEETTGMGFKLAHQLDRGGRYRVLVTTAGGLYRYHLRDEVEIVGFHHQCPLLRFLGKCDHGSDLVGEKLAEPHVRSVLERLSVLSRVRARFTLLVPALGSPPRYRLYLQGPSLDTCTQWLQELCGELQSGLEENPYYRHAVAVGQLAPVEACVLDPEGEPGWLVYECCRLEQGQKSGDIKPLALDRWTGWPDRFAPLLRATSGGTPYGMPPSPADSR